MSALTTVAPVSPPAPPVFHIVPAARKQDHLSYSQIRSYATCSLKWWFSRRYEPEIVPSALVFGKSWHAAVERYYQLALEGRPQNLTTLLEAFFTEYKLEKKPIQYGKTDAAPTEEQVSRMLEVFLASVHPGKVIAIEQEIRVPLGENLPDLLGYIDLVEIVQTNADWSLQLVDFKTCGKDPGDSIDADQLLLYAWAAKETGLLREFALPLQLRYDYLLKKKMPEYGTLPVEVRPDAIQRIHAKIRQCWRGMREEIVYPCPGWQCTGCGYKARCGKWPQNAPQVPASGKSECHTEVTAR